jgi:uncharacterized protein
MLEIELQGERVYLLPERALWWEKENTLIIADLHWGKSAHFRKHGIAITAKSQEQDEMRLAGLINRFNTHRLIIAGDMFHSRSNKEVEIFGHFRQLHNSLHIDLVMGNHDILSKDQYSSWQLSSHKECLETGPFCIAHDHMENKNKFVIHGHVHPALRIKSKGGNQPTIKLCCFAQTKEKLILPAFGQFTGNHVLEDQDFQHIYLIAEKNVIQWK